MKIKFFPLILKLSLFILVFGIFGISKAQATTGALYGYAWSDNIGWISFNCKDTDDACSTNDYSVTVDNSTGKLSGYAWSDNIGWIGFNDTSDCPETGCTTQPKLDLPRFTTATDEGGGTMKGWGRACSPYKDGCGDTNMVLKDSYLNGGWDGWMSFDGVEIADKETGGDYPFSGYAWGSEVAGWIDMTGVYYTTTDPDAIPTSSFTISATPDVVVSGSNSVTVSWTITGPMRANTGNAYGCYAIENPASLAWTGQLDASVGTHTLTLTNIEDQGSGTAAFRMTCLPKSGSPVSDSATVKFIYFGLDTDTNCVRSNESPVLTWTPKNATSCIAGPGWTGTKDGSDGKHKETQSPITTAKTYGLYCENNTVTPTIKTTGQSIEIPICVPNFALQVNPINQTLITDSADPFKKNTITQGRINVKLIPLNGFNSPVSFSVLSSETGGTIDGLTPTYTFYDAVSGGNKITTTTDYNNIYLEVKLAGLPLKASYPIAITVNDTLGKVSSKNINASVSSGKKNFNPFYIEF